MPANFSAFGSGPTPSTTAATAGIIKVDQGSTLASVTIYEWEIGPHANSADENYTVRLKRQTTAGTWTAATPSNFDGHPSPVASLATAGVVSTAAGTGGVELGRWGYHMRGGYRWAARQGGELAVLIAAAGGIILEYIFAQGTSLQDGTIMFTE